MSVSLGDICDVYLKLKLAKESSEWWFFDVHVIVTARGVSIAMVLFAVLETVSIPSLSKGTVLFPSSPATEEALIYTAFFLRRDTCLVVSYSTSYFMSDGASIDGCSDAYMPCRVRA